MSEFKQFFYNIVRFFSPLKSKSVFKKGDLIAIKADKNLERWEAAKHKENREVYRVLEVGKKKYRVELLKRKETEKDTAHQKMMGLNQWLSSALVMNHDGLNKYEVNKNYELIPESQFDNDLWELSDES